MNDVSVSWMDWERVHFKKKFKFSLFLLKLHYVDNLLIDQTPLTNRFCLLFYFFNRHVDKKLFYQASPLISTANLHIILTHKRKNICIILKLHHICYAKYCCAQVHQSDLFSGSVFSHPRWTDKSCVYILARLTVSQVTSQVVFVKVSDRRSQSHSALTQHRPLGHFLVCRRHTQTTHDTHT